MRLQDVHVGDLVSWSSHGGSGTATKVGRVIYVGPRRAAAPPHDTLDRYIPNGDPEFEGAGVLERRALDFDDLMANSIRRCDYLGPVTVAVVLQGVNGALKPRVYSPRLTHLRKAPKGADHVCPR